MAALYSLPIIWWRFLPANAEKTPGCGEVMWYFTGNHKKKILAQWPLFLFIFHDCRFATKLRKSAVADLFQTWIFKNVWFFYFSSYQDLGKMIHWVSWLMGETRKLQFLYCEPYALWAWYRLMETQGLAVLSDSPMKPSGSELGTS